MHQIFTINSCHLQLCRRTSQELNDTAATNNNFHLKSSSLWHQFLIDFHRSYFHQVTRTLKVFTSLLTGIQWSLSNQQLEYIVLHWYPLHCRPMPLAVKLSQRPGFKNMLTVCWVAIQLIITNTSRYLAVQTTILS